jgi:hypothetical protein
VDRLALKWRAEEALRDGLQPGERIAAGSAVTSDPSRWGAAALLAAAVAVTAAALASLLGPLPAGPACVLAVPVLGLGIQFLPRPMYIAVTGRQLIGCRLSRLRTTPRRPAFAAPLAELRIVNYRSGRYGTSFRCEMPGRKPMLLHVGRSGRKDFAEVDMVLARSGAFAKLDPPYPCAGRGPRAATGPPPRAEPAAGSL